jgi:hypothetical protein
MKNGSLCTVTQQPSWMWTDDIQVIRIVGSYVVAQCRERRGKGWARTLGIFPVSEIEDTRQSSPVSNEYSKPGRWGQDWVNAMVARCEQLQGGIK